MTTTQPTSRSTWFALFAPATAWSVQELASSVITYYACVGRSAGAGRAGILVVSLVALAAAIAAIALGRGRFREVATDGPLSENDGRGREEMLALGGVIIGAVFAVGIVWTALPAIFVSDLCGAKR